VNQDGCGVMMVMYPNDISVYTSNSQQISPVLIETAIDIPEGASNITGMDESQESIRNCVLQTLEAIAHKQGELEPFLDEFSEEITPHDDHMPWSFKEPQEQFTHAEGASFPYRIFIACLSIHF
jgi:hypothetical protein